MWRDMGHPGWKVQTLQINIQEYYELLREKKQQQQQQQQQ